MTTTCPSANAMQWVAALFVISLFGRRARSVREVQHALKKLHGTLAELGVDTAAVAP
ncbi:hypothetical protein [Synechococcus sp. CBW1006]|uniref:hypothetical protein n=1 Tax=Synechococcus sp. CBW1006 TaxID=1353138 RepID=UPI0018CFA5D2|nr:hypothetical protein [Synechococcus sp. CBW1006]QPN68091.1 hypothetical protein H8F26_08440 [Synechococcus sp. CBW1006]